MNMERNGYLTIILLISTLVLAVGCSSDDETAPAPGANYQETLTQVSTIDAIINGVYDGVISYGDLRERGGFGIGTFAGLDGEMIALEGDFYQIKADGVAYEVTDDMTTPFAVVTSFDTDRQADLEAGMDYADVQSFIDNLVPTENIFYAIKIDGTFQHVKTRSVPPQTKPYPPLVEVTENQPEFEFRQVKGTLVGFRSPPYVTGINVPGYHLHFITEDRQSGGHVLELEIGEATLMLDDTSGFFMILPGEGSDFYAIDLSQDKGDELEEAEK